MVGAACGLIGDAGHVDSGTTRYIDDSVPFIWESALWFPILVGLGVASIGALRLRLAPPRPGFDLRVGVGAAAAVTALYSLTSLVHDQPETASLALVTMLAVLIVAWLADGWPSIACGLLAAVIGPAVEILIVGLDWSEYAESADGLFGVAPFLVPLYVAAGVAAARIAELMVARRSG